MAKPTASDDDEESAWEDDGDHESEEEFLDEQDDAESVEYGRKPPARRSFTQKKNPPAPPPVVRSAIVAQPEATAKNKPPRKDTRQKQRKRKTDEAFDNSQVVLPSYARKTQRGGYSHTESSRWKIGHANRGNEPWNKGKIRSSSDKANISKGVKDRNRKVLLVNLAKFGMTEEEYADMKKEIKYVRERVRVTKKNNAQLKESRQKIMEQQKLLEEAEKVWKREVDKEMDEEEAERLAELTKKTLDEEEDDDDDMIAELVRNAEEENSKPPAKAGSIEEKVGTEEDDVDEDEEEDEEAEMEGSKWPAPQFIREEIHWTPHSYDTGKGNEEEEYNASSAASWKDENDPCPNGGPGGLICCRLCTKSYASFMAETLQEMEREKNANLVEERNEVVELLRQTKNNLAVSLQAAKRTVPPPPPPPLSPVLPPPFSKQNEAQQQQQNRHQQTKGVSGTKRKGK
jgi:NUMOD3 motif